MAVQYPPLWHIQRRALIAVGDWMFCAMQRRCVCAMQQNRAPLASRYIRKVSRSRRFVALGPGSWGKERPPAGGRQLGRKRPGRRPSDVPVAPDPSGTLRAITGTLPSAGLWRRLHRECGTPACSQVLRPETRPPTDIAPMITAFRRYLETWVVRGLFLIMAIAFIVWGVGDVVRMVGSPTWVAKVDGQTIEGALFQAEYQRALTQASAKLPPGQDAPASLRNSIGDETLRRLIQQAALQQEVQRLRVVVPDSAIRQTILAMPAFRDKQGRFSSQLFQAVLQQQRPERAKLRSDDARRPGAASGAGGGRHRRRRPAGGSSSPVPGAIRKAFGRHGGISVRCGNRPGAHPGGPAALVRKPSVRLQLSRNAPRQGDHPVAADFGEGDSDHRRGAARRL